MWQSNMLSMTGSTASALFDAGRRKIERPSSHSLCFDNNEKPSQNIEMVSYYNNAKLQGNKAPEKTRGPCLFRQRGRTTVILGRMAARRAFTLVRD
jgi:hypothetical protein